MEKSEQGKSFDWGCQSWSICHGGQALFVASRDVAGVKILGAPSELVSASWAQSCVSPYVNRTLPATMAT